MKRLILLTKLKSRARISKIIDTLKLQEINFIYIYYPLKYKKLPKAISHLHWNLFVFFNVIKYYRKSVFYVVGFDTGLIALVFSKLLRYSFIYDNADNISISKNYKTWLKKLLAFFEEKIIENAYLHIVPHKVRLNYYNHKGDFHILPNYPTSNTFDKAKKIAGKLNFTKARLVIYINGWLVETRGRKMILEFLENLPQGLDLKVFIASPQYEEIYKNNPYIEYLGLLPYEEALSYYFISDLVFTFYDPRIEINKIATPNKWGDAILTNTVPVLNKGIQTVNDYFPEGGYIEIEYNASDQLANTVIDCYNYKESLDQKKELLNKYEKKLFDIEFNKILNKI